MMDFMNRAQPSMEKVFTMSHLRSDTRQHLKKVYSALTLTLLAAAGGSVLAHMIPILANVWINMLGSMFLIYNIATNKTSQKERLVKLIAFGVLTGAGLRPLLEFSTRINPALVPTALSLTASVFVAFSLCALMTQQRSMLYLGSMLSSCLLSMAVVSLMNLFVGSTGIQNMLLYGGVCVMSGFVCYDTQLIVARYEAGDRDFIHHSLDLFLDFVSLFRKILIILSKKENDKERKRRRD